MELRVFRLMRGTTKGTSYTMIEFTEIGQHRRIAVIIIYPVSRWYRIGTVTAYLLALLRAHVCP